MTRATARPTEASAQTTDTPDALVATGLGHRHRRGWALRDCSFRLPRGRICALVGPKGAGKSTLLSLAAGMLPPSEGTVTVLGHPSGASGARRRVGYLGQDRPLYPQFTVEETLRVGRERNGTWDQALAERLVAEGAVPLSARIRALSDDQRTRIALALALGRRPDLLLLDEPMSGLGPSGRREMTRILRQQAAERGMTVLMSSRMIAHLEGACDHLVLLSHGNIRLAGETDRILAAHHRLLGDASQASLLPHPAIIAGREHLGRLSAIVRLDEPLSGRWTTTRLPLAELLLAYLGAPAAPPMITEGARIEAGGLRS
ncbi:ABC transporter ATP-binding protein [Streptomyces sp. NPDC101393]|uniref:ABC transporter ATP-binding protein n=1 Tax=Streptomyces sp. NPDC101393 TaxID=3366141 RepID=UPI0037F7CC45